MGFWKANRAREGPRNKVLFFGPRPMSRGWTRTVRRLPRTAPIGPAESLANCRALDCNKGHCKAVASAHCVPLACPGLSCQLSSAVSTASSTGCLVRARLADDMSAGQCATRDRHSAIGCTSRDADMLGTPARLQKVWRKDGSDPCWLGRVCLSPGGLSDQPCGAHISVTRSPRPGPVQGRGGLWLAGEPQAGSGSVCW